MITRLLPHLKDNKLYIIPTMDGLKAFTICILLLIIGLTYANNYAILFSFLFFSFLFVSMFYTHYNLTQLNLESLKAQDFFAKTPGYFSLRFEGHNYMGNHYLQFQIELSDKTRILSKDVGLSGKMTKSIPIEFTPVTRGEVKIESVLIETLFPFNFFKVFKVYRPKFKTIVYPESKQGDNHVVDTNKELHTDEDDEIKIRNFNIGDSLKRVDWKRLAQSNKWFVRDFTSLDQRPILLKYEGLDIENALSAITYLIIEAESRNIQYGIEINQKLIIEPCSGKEHLYFCLKELALYDT